MRQSICQITKEIFEVASLKKIVIASAESCTGGMLSSAITDIPGSSAIFECGFVTYSNISKMKLLNVNQITLESFGAVSEEVAAEMAIGALKNSKANIAISVTGIAGPGGSDTKPEGMVCFSVAFEKDIKLTKTKQFGPLGRNLVREKATIYGLNLLKSVLSKRP